jgi:UDP-glucose:(heptosyl)LPS alpha-1,3-glucosyltransferase
MKIALVVDRFDACGGGLEQWVYQLTLSLLKSGHEVHVVTFEFCHGPVDSTLMVHRLQRPPGRLERAATFERFLRELRPDVIHDMGEGWHYDVFQPQGSKYANDLHEAMSLSLGARLRRRLLPSHMRRRRELKALEERQYASRQGIIIAVSRMVRDQLVLYHNVDPSRVILVYNGADPSRFSSEHGQAHRARIRQELGLKGEVLYLMAAHNFRLKGVGQALEAMRSLKDATPPCHLAIIGRGQIEPYKGIAKRLGIENSVTFCGFVDDPVPYYAGADVFVQPTFYDACSLSVLEAWASGLPVITSRFNGAAELMTPGVQGFILGNPRDTQALADTMKLLLDEALRFKMARAARLLGLKQTLDKNFNAIEKIYHRVARHRTGVDVAMRAGGCDARC